MKSHIDHTTYGILGFLSVLAGGVVILGTLTSGLTGMTGSIVVGVLLVYLGVICLREFLDHAVMKDILSGLGALGIDTAECKTGQDRGKPVTWNKCPFPFGSRKGFVRFGAEKVIFTGQVFLTDAQRQAGGYYIRNPVLAALNLPLRVLYRITDLIREQVTNHSEIIVPQEAMIAAYTTSVQVNITLRDGRKAIFNAASEADAASCANRIEEADRSLRRHDPEPAGIRPRGGGGGSSGRAVSEERNVDVNMYSHLLIQQMIASGRQTITINESAALPGVAGWPEKQPLPQFEQVVNQVKVLSQLFPQKYPRIVSGQFKLTCQDPQGRSVSVSVRTQFSDKPPKSWFVLNVANVAPGS